MHNRPPVRRPTRSFVQRLAVAACVAFLAGASAAPGSASAQTQAVAGPLVAVQDGTRQVPPLSLTVAQLDGMVIMYSTQQIAHVSGVLANPAGDIVAVKARHGGFFGYFQKEAVLPLASLNKGDGYLNSSVSAETLKTLPAWQ